MIVVLYIAMTFIGRAERAHPVAQMAGAQECKELELFFGTNYLQQCLNSPDNAIHIVREAKSHLIEEDWNQTISIALTHSSLVHVTQARNCE